MRLREIFALALIILFSCNSGIENSSRPKSKLRIAVAANFYAPFKKLEQIFEERYDVDLEATVSSSGKLTAQILTSAPFDLFLSADTSFPERLIKRGLGTGKPIPYARGLLAIWSKTPLENYQHLQIGETDKIGIPNPKTAPYGLLAEELLGNLNVNSKHVIYGESVSQVNSFIKSQSMDFAITSGSFVKQIDGNFSGYLMTIDTSYYTPITQAALILTTNPEAEIFVKFLLSEESQKLISNFGYLPVRNE